MSSTFLQMYKLRVFDPCGKLRYLSKAHDLMIIWISDCVREIKSFFNHWFLLLERFFVFNDFINLISQSENNCINLLKWTFISQYKEVCWKMSDNINKECTEGVLHSKFAGGNLYVCVILSRPQKTSIASDQPLSKYSEHSTKT